jgi:prolyl oligopeptidase
MRHAITTSSVIALIYAAGAMAAPAPRAVPVTETVHGYTLTDEYRWMEDPANAAEMAGWVKAEAAETRAALAALPERAGFLAKLKEVSSGLTRVRDVQMGGDTVIFRRATAADRTAKLIVVRDGKERVLIDPNSGSGPVFAIGAVSLSPDGKMVAAHTSQGGSEVGAIQIYDTATGAKVGAPFENIWGEFPIGWLGGDLISYTQMAKAGEYPDPISGMRAYVKRLGDPGPGKQILGPGGSGPRFELKEFPILGLGSDTGWTFAVAAGARADNRYWIARTDRLTGADAGWRQVAALEDRVQGVDVLGNSLVVWTTKTNGAGSIMARTLSDAEIGAPVSIFEGNDRLIVTNMSAARDGLYVTAMTDGTTRLFYSPDARKFSEVALPFAGGDVLDFGNRADGKGITLAYSGWLANTRTFLVESGKVTQTNFNSTTWDGAKAFAVDRLEARSADGTMVPLVVVRPGGALPKGGMPVILEGYGGYGISTATPFYNRDGMAWVARGGAAAYCGIRGGGERGRAWHEAGRGLNKPNGHADFIACAETLKARGYAPAKGVVATGASMGGALVPPAVLKRPDLFAAMVPRVAVLNATRMAAAPNGANQFDEMGDPATPDGFKALVGMDAYQMLPAAEAIPPTLLTIGLNDKRVTPWMSAKFAARAKAKFAGKQAIWLRADDETGHGVGSAEDARVAENADIFAFAWDRSRP